MVITGSCEAFKEFIQHRPDIRYGAWIYTLTHQGRVQSVLHSNAQIQWNFPANDPVTVALLKDFFQTMVEVISWTL